MSYVLEEFFEFRDERQVSLAPLTVSVVTWGDEGEKGEEVEGVTVALTMCRCQGW